MVWRAPKKGLLLDSFSVASLLQNSRRPDVERPLPFAVTGCF